MQSHASPFRNTKRGASILDASPNDFAQNYIKTLQDKRDHLIGGNTDELKDIRENIDEFTKNLRGERVEMMNTFFNKIELQKQQIKNKSKKVIRAQEPNYKEKRQYIEHLADNIKGNEIDNLI